LERNCNLFKVLHGILGDKDHPCPLWEKFLDVAATGSEVRISQFQWSGDAHNPEIERSFIQTGYWGLERFVIIERLVKLQ
jgi:hypothetical protein